MLVVNARGDLPPIALILFQTMLFCFFGPAMLHGAIAGERERRSWDLLLVDADLEGADRSGQVYGRDGRAGIGAAAMGLPICLGGGIPETGLWDLPWPRRSPCRSAP